MKQIDAKITLSKKLQDILDGKISNQIVHERDMAQAAAMIHFFILSRTAKGKFLNKGHKNRRYNTAYEVMRFRKKGYTNEHVTLSFTGSMLDALTSKITHEKGVPTAMVGYFEGETDPLIYDIAGFHNYLGAGKSKRLREFVGLSAQEKGKVVAFINRRIGKNLQ